MSDYPLFSVIGIEIEYMLVDTDTLDVQPKSDLILQALAGEFTNEAHLDEISVSNELVMHVLELKNKGPALPYAPLASQFQEALLSLQIPLKEYNLQLMPTGAHPWMDPLSETKRWPHDSREIYQQFDAIFNCKGHGFANLQSMHINLPFSNDLEFNQLHNSIRLLLPLIPGLAASTPILEGAFTGMQDTRLDFYAKNQQRIPSISGEIIPDFISSKAEYLQKILHPMYQDIQPFDPKGLLQYEWLNSRAAIPKFDMKAIEIRIIDTQEYVNADIAIAKVIFAILKKWQHNAHFLENPCETQRLKNLYDKIRVNGLSVAIEDNELKRQWQLSKPVKTCRDVWSVLIEEVISDLDWISQKALETILSQGNLSERLLKACNENYQRDNLMSIYRELGDCLLSNREFIP